MNATEYEQRVQQMAEALHRDCELVWQARQAVDPRTQPDRWDAHGVRFHFGQAHDLVRRVFGEAGAEAPEKWQWQCAECKRSVPPMGMCETCGVFGILRLAPVTP